MAPSSRNFAINSEPTESQVSERDDSSSNESLDDESMADLSS